MGTCAKFQTLVQCVKRSLELSAGKHIMWWLCAA
jgi:hypothetical protein